VTLSELLAERVRVSPDGEAYRQFEAARGAWIGYSWAEVARRVAQWRAALRAERLPGGGRVAVLVPNSLEHVCVDQAALAEGLVPVPLHVIDSPESLAYVLADSGAALLCIDSAERWAGLAGFESRLPQLRRVVCLSGVPSGGVARSAPEWLAAAGTNVSGGESNSGQDASALAAIVYTSGTTGRPKGVMLTHRNVLANVRALLTVLPVSEADTFLSFLPLSHTLERTCGYYLPLAAGATVAFARSIPALMDDLQTIRPTVLVSVPRIYERAYTALHEQVGRRALTRAALSLAVRVGWRHFERAQRNPAAARPTLLERLLDARVGAPLRARFGGRVRAAVTGGAAIPEPVARTFLALGLPLLQGYGMTESAPVVSCNVPEDNDPSSVGRPLPDVEVRLGERDELLVRGPNVMPGYWQRPEETAQALDAEGWLHTGDQARVKDGRLYISGRIKDIIVTSTGEKIAPADIEAAIEVDPVFEQAWVIGEGRPYVAALVVLNRSAWKREAVRLGLNPEDPASLRSQRALEWALERIAAAVRAWPRYAHPRVAWLTLDPWTVGAGQLTPTLKLKRNALATRFESEIAELYRGHTV
jgi:long-chain acyl-CoA synthetase